MTAPNIVHHKAFEAELLSGIERTLRRAHLAAGCLAAAKPLDQAELSWLSQPRSEEGPSLLKELHSAEAKLLGWIDQSFDLEIGGKNLPLHALLNRNNLQRSQLVFAAEMEGARFSLESLLSELQAAKDSAPSIAQAVSAQLANWEDAKNRIVRRKCMTPPIPEGTTSFVVPNADLAREFLPAAVVPERRAQVFEAPQPLLERTLVGGPAEFPWAEELESPRGCGIRQQILLRPGRDGNVLRIMRHRGQVEGSYLRNAVMPDTLTVDEVLKLSHEAREKVIRKGSWVSDLTATRLNTFCHIPGAVLLTLESLKQEVDFFEFESLQSEESSNAQFLLMEQTDQSSNFLVQGNLLLFQQPELLPEWQYIPEELTAGRRAAWCAGLRVMADTSTQAVPHQGSQMLDTAMVNLLRNNGFNRLLAKVLDGPTELANRVAMDIHKQNGWKKSNHSFEEVLEIVPGNKIALSWCLIYRDI